MAGKEGIGLRELIEKIKSDLREPHGDPLFIVGHIDLEISFTVERTLDGGIKLQVIEAGAEKKSTEAQTVRVALEPITAVEEMRKKLKANVAVSQKITMIERDLTAEVERKGKGEIS